MKQPERETLLKAIGLHVAETVANALAPFEERIATLEQRTPEKGEKGLDGKDGLNGKDGADGLNGLNGTDGRNGIDGKNGLDGKDGLNGSDGKDGKDGTIIDIVPDFLADQVAKAVTLLAESPKAEPKSTIVLNINSGDRPRSKTITTRRDKSGQLVADVVEREAV